MACYTLPSSPSVQCEDRFSILSDGDELYVSFWSLLSKLLQDTDINSPETLAELLDTIAVTRRGKSDSDYGFLKQFISEQPQSKRFLQQMWPKIKDLALEMPSLFPNHRLPILKGSQRELLLSRRQVACLVVHQFLCTLDAPSWQDGFQDFHIWYSAEQPDSKAVHAYLTALFEYFRRLASAEDGSPLIDEWPTFYTLHICDSDFSSQSRTTLTPLRVLDLPEASTSPSLLGLPDGAGVISANKFIGFGRTGTQEETHVGASPECCPAVLVTPPLRNDEAMVVTGAEAMITISGYQRDAHCSEIFSPSPDGNHHLMWRRRTMLFMDALELDLESRDEGLPDLRPRNVDRELRKAYTAFQSRKDPPYSNIYTGYWGCGTFGGNPGVKAIVQWCAASLAGCPMTFVCNSADRTAFGELLSKFVAEMIALRATVALLVEVARTLDPSTVNDAKSVLLAVSEKVKERAEEQHVK